MGEPSIGLFRKACGAPDTLNLEIQSEGEAPEHQVLPQPFAVIGRDERADIPLMHQQVSKRHAYLQVIAGRVFCVDLGSREGILWEGGTGPSGWMEGGSPIWIGPYRIKLREDGLDTAKSLTAPALPSPLSHPMSGTIPLPDVALEFLKFRTRSSWQMNDRVLALVGRSRDCQVRIPDLSVSRFHCSLLRTPLGVWVVDLLGREGIQINGENVPWARLDDGDELSVGKYQFRIRCIPNSGRGHRLEGPPGVKTRALNAPGPRPSPPGRPEVRSGPGRELEPVTTPSRPRFHPPATAGEPEPPTWPSPAHEPGQILVEKPSERDRLAEPFFELVIQKYDRMQQQMSDMQQQMSDQFHEVTMAMIQMFGTIHREQMDMVRGELDEIHRLSEELKELKANSSRHSPAPQDPTTAAAPGQHPSDPDDRIRPPDARPASQASPPLSPADLPAGRASSLSARGPERPTPADASSHRNRPLAVEAAGSSPEPEGRGPEDCPAGQVDDFIHVALSRRIAELQRERQSRWHKILDLVTGN